MKKTRCVGLLAVALVAPFLAWVTQAQETPAKGGGWFANWSPDLVLEGKLGTERSIGTAELMFPLTQAPDSVWFLDLRGRFDDDDSIEGNLGLGYRTTLNDCWIWGVYGYADFLESTYDNTFWGGTLGSELMSENVIFRINGYLPESSEKDVDLAAAKVVGNSIVVVGEDARERALPGGDLEVGYRFASLIPGIEAQDMWLYVGGFYFDASGYEKVAGPRVRAEWNIDTDFAIAGSQLTVGGEWQTDDQRDGQAYLTVALRIPLGGGEAAKGEKDWRRRSLWRRVVRDVDIVSGVSGLDEETPAINPLTGEAFGKIIFSDGDNDIAGDGSLGDPAAIGNAITLAEMNGIIVGLGGKGNLNAGGGQNLLDGQVLSGGGGTVRVATTGGRILPLQLPGTPGTIEGTGTDGNYLLGLADGNTVQDLTFVRVTPPRDGRPAPEISAIHGAAIQNATLRNLTIDGTNGLARGIDIDNAVGVVEVDNVSVSNTSKEAIRLKGDKDLVRDDAPTTLDVMLTGVTTDAAGAVKAEELNGGNVTVDGLTVTDQADGGEALKVKDGGTVSIANVNITNGAKVSVEKCGDVTVQDVNVTNQSEGNESVKTKDCNNVTLERVAVNVGGQVKIEDTLGDVTVTDSSVTDINKDKDAFEIKNTGGTVALNNNQVVNFTGTTKAAFKIDTAGDVSGTGNTTTNVDHGTAISGVGGAGQVEVDSVLHP